MIFTLFAAKLKQKWAKKNKRNKFRTQKLDLITRDLGQQLNINLNKNGQKRTRKIKINNCSSKLPSE